MRIGMAAVSVASFNPQDPRFTVRGLADEFRPYGTLRSVQVWQPGLAVVEFEDLRSVLDAVSQHDRRHGWRVRPIALPHTTTTSAHHFRHFEHLVHQHEPGRGGPGPGNPLRRGGPGLGRNVCYRCNEPGHTARDCRLLRRRPAGRRTRTNASPRNRMSYNPRRRMSYNPRRRMSYNPRRRSRSSNPRQRSRSSDPPNRSMNPNPRNRMSSNLSNRIRSPTPPTTTRKRRRSPSPPTPRNRSRSPNPPRSRRRRSSRILSPPRNRSRSPPGYGHRRSYDTAAGSSAQNLKDH